MGFKVSCPACDAVLRPAKALKPDQKVKCPKCGESFTYYEDLAKPVEPPKVAAKTAQKTGPDARTSSPARDDGRDIAREKKPAAPKPAGPTSSSAKRTESKATAPSPPPKTDDDDDEIATYGVKDAVEETEVGKVSYAPNTSIRDLRGPATSAVIGPSNALIYAGMISALTCVLTFAYMVWPWVFPPEGGYVLKVEETLKAKFSGEKNIPTTAAEMKDIHKKAMAEAESEDKQERIIFAILAVFQFFYNLIMAVGAVKMQNLESYNWGMASAIMGISPLTLSGPGVWALTVLLKKDVKAGFEYKGMDF